MPEQETAPRPVWEADSTHPSEASILRAALRQVVDPELGLSIIDLGLVRQVSIADGEIQMRMILTTPFCPYGPAMIEMTRAKAEEAGGMTARIDLSPEPWDPSMMEEGAAGAWGLF